MLGDGARHLDNGRLLEAVSANQLARDLCVCVCVVVVGGGVFREEIGVESAREAGKNFHGQGKRRRIGAGWGV